LKSSNAPAPN